jgi:hypothetical protein
MNQWRRDRFRRAEVRPPGEQDDRAANALTG